MKTSLLIAGLAILITAGVALAMGDLYVFGKWRYKMTVEVETPEGTKTGAAVWEVSNAYSSLVPDFPEAGNPAEVKGEAVVVDLGERGVLFALISSQLTSEFYKVFPVPDGGPTTVKGIQYYRSLKPGTSAPLPEKQWPKMVTFEDMDNPKSVALVRGSTFNTETQEYEQVDRMEELFGEGVRLKSITFEITDEPVTWAVVDEYLPEGARNLNMTYSYFSWPNEKIK